jgi:hypothetical protein
VQRRLRFEMKLLHINILKASIFKKFCFILLCRGAYFLAEREEALFCLDFLLLFHHGKSKKKA